MTTASPRRPIDAILRWFGLAAHLAIGFFPFAATGLLAPPWALVAVALLWLGAAILAVRTARRHPRWTPVVPLGALAVWFAFLTFGDLVLGWTA